MWPEVRPSRECIYMQSSHSRGTEPYAKGWYKYRNAIEGAEDRFLFPVTAALYLLPDMVSCSLESVQFVSSFFSSFMNKNTKQLTRDESKQAFLCPCFYFCVAKIIMTLTRVASCPFLPMRARCAATFTVYIAYVVYRFNITKNCGSLFFFLGLHS